MGKNDKFLMLGDQKEKDQKVYQKYTFWSCFYDD